MKPQFTEPSTIAAFQLLGFDILLDSSLNPHLLEVPHSLSDTQTRARVGVRGVRVSKSEVRLRVRLKVGEWFTNELITTFFISFLPYNYYKLGFFFFPLLICHGTNIALCFVPVTRSTTRRVWRPIRFSTERCLCKKKKTKENQQKTQNLSTGLKSHSKNHSNPK